MNSFLNLKNKIIFRNRFYIIKCIIKNVCIKCEGRGIDTEEFDSHLFDNNFNHEDYKDDIYLCNICLGTGKFQYKDHLSSHQLIVELSYLFDQFLSLENEKIFLEKENKELKDLINFR